MTFCHSEEPWLGPLRLFQQDCDWMNLPPTGHRVTHGLSLLVAQLCTTSAACLLCDPYAGMPGAGRHRVPQEAGHHLPLVLTCWLVFSCSQPHPGCCVEDVETWAGPAQSFIHRVCSWWRALTSEITATFGKGKKMKREKQKGKESSSPWPAGKRTYKRSSEETPPLHILSGDICHLSADKFPMVII